MLVLSRRLHESIVLPNSDATITILSISGGQVRLGISAPGIVAIYRQEVWERLKLEAATLASGASLDSTPAPRVPR
jgi:carbon storage regulator